MYTTQLSTTIAALLKEEARFVFSTFFPFPFFCLKMCRVAVFLLLHLLCVVTSFKPNFNTNMAKIVISASLFVSPNLVSADASPILDKRAKFSIGLSLSLIDFIFFFSQSSSVLLAKWKKKRQQVCVSNVCDCVNLDVCYLSLIWPIWGVMNGGDGLIIVDCWDLGSGIWDFAQFLQLNCN